MLETPDVVREPAGNGSRSDRYQAGESQRQAAGLTSGAGSPVFVPSDEELMLAVAGGDLSAFGQIVARHQTTAWNAAYRFLGNAADAEDIAQEAFLRILDSADRYQPTASFRTYLYRIVSRLCFDLSRRKRLRRHQLLPDLTTNGPSPEDVSLLEERAAAVRQALDSLPPAQKMAVVLRYYQDLGYWEIAAVLNTTDKGVERLLARARATLEGRLGGFLED
jgi:RNA polymerase sigma-70 factor (ECF subfamily)